jgi:hypothetical protein
MFAQVENAWATMVYPPLLDYVVVVSVKAGDAARTDHYSGQAEPAAAAFRVRKFSREEEENPTVPHGVNVSVGVGFTSGNGPMGSGSRVVGSFGGADVLGPDPLGVPEITPLYAFGLRHCVSRRTSQEIDATAPKTIGVVVAVRRRYRVTTVGTETLDGHDAVHLALVPLIDAHHDRLRDLWIDPTTLHVLQARVFGNFSGPHESPVAWLIRFTTIDGATYIASETAEAPIRSGPRAITAVHIQFDDIAPDAGSPGLAFAIPQETGDGNSLEEPDDGQTSC